MNGNGHSVMSPMEMEPVLGKKATNTDEEDQPNSNPLQTLHNLWLLIVAYAEYYQGTILAVISVLIMTSVIVLLEKIAYASTTKTHRPNIRKDYSNASTMIDLQFGKIDHWCLQGGDDYCRCDDPTIGLSNEQTKGWTKAHKMNKELIDGVAWSKDLDVVILGDAAVEEWNGRWLGKENDKLSAIKGYFKKTFSVAGGGEVNGLALGIAGDTISNLLWRVQHGELPNSLNPKVWWILIGSNDLGSGQCAEEAVLLGMLRLADTISMKKPNSVVVINSILPRPPPAKSKHDRRKRLDLWPYIDAVNGQLQKFCDNQNVRFSYFDANPLFLTEKGTKGHTKITVNQDLISDGTHLTLAGHKLWGEAIVTVVKQLKTKKNRDVFDTTNYANTEQNYDYQDDIYDDDWASGTGDSTTDSSDKTEGSSTSGSDENPTTSSAGSSMSSHWDDRLTLDDDTQS